MPDLTIIINDAPYGIEKPWNALRLTSTSTTDELGMVVKVFLMGDAVLAAKKGQKTPDGYCHHVGFSLIIIGSYNPDRGWNSVCSRSN